MKEKIVVKKNQDTYLVPAQNVIYMEKALRKIVIHLAGMSEKELVVYGSFRDLIPDLDERFLCLTIRFSLLLMKGFTSERTPIARL